MTTPPAGPDQPSHGHEYPPMENSGPSTDAYPPLDYPTDGGQRQQGAPGQFGYPPPAPAYPQAGYLHGGYPPPPPLPGAPYQGYQGGYPQSYDPYGQYGQYGSARPIGTNGKAIAALVTSVAGMLFCGLPSIVGLILGVIAMRETKRTGQEGHGLALAGVIVGALSAAGWLLYVVVILFAIAVSSSTSYGY